METEEEILKRAKRALESAEKELDAETLARLREARRQAIEEGLNKPMRTRPGWWLPVGGFATAGIVLAVAGLLWFSTPVDHSMQIGMSDIDLLGAQENPDFFTELEFYEWLEDRENAG